MIDIGSPISAGGGEGAYGRLGLLVTDATGSLLALTSRELLFGGERVSHFAGGGRAFFGQRWAPYHPAPDDPGAAVRLAAWFCPGIEVSESLGAWGDKRVLDVDGMLGSKVVAAAGRDVRTGGVVIRTDWFADVSANPGEAAQAYEGLIRVAVAGDLATGVRRGVSGALLLTEDDELVGIVVGLYGDDLIAVPLISILRSENLSVATVEDIRSHNRAMREARQVYSVENHERGFISLISSRMGFEKGSLDAPEAIVSRWIVHGLNASATRSPLGAFEPFGEYFTNLRGDLRNLQTSIMTFAISGLRAYDDHVVATEALEMAMLELLGGPGEAPRSVRPSSLPVDRPRGSHDHVRA